MSNLDYQTVFKQEQERLCRLHPGPSDIPGCFSLFNDYVSCGGMFLNFYPRSYVHTHRPSHSLADQSNL